MQKSESVINIAKALSAFQAEVENPKNTASNPFFKSKYAPLPDILNIARPIMAKHGLSIIQSPSSADGEKIVITTLLLHSSGEWIETCPLILKADKITAQGAGSAITYGRRYALSAVLGISSEDDDDGNHASKLEAPRQAQKPQAQAQPETPRKTKMTAEDWKIFWGSIRQLGYEGEDIVLERAGVTMEDLAKYTPQQARQLYNKLKEEKQIA